MLDMFLASLVINEKIVKISLNKVIKISKENIIYLILIITDSVVKSKNKI